MQPPEILPLNIVISQENGQPIIELRQRIRKIELIKAVITCAFHEQPLSMMPCFSNKLKSVCTLVDKGVLCKKINKGVVDYEFLI